jgi:hypothetical protein
MHCVCSQWFKKSRFDGICESMNSSIGTCCLMLFVIRHALCAMKFALCFTALTAAKVLVMMPFCMILWLGSTVAFCVTVALYVLFTILFLQLMNIYFCWVCLRFAIMMPSLVQLPLPLRQCLPVYLESIPLFSGLGRFTSVLLRRGCAHVMRACQ